MQFSSFYCIIKQRECQALKKGVGIMKKKFALAIVLALAFSILASAFSMVAVAAADYEAVDLEWKKGSYYDSLTADTNNRYYSVLRCAEGDTIKIHLPSVYLTFYYLTGACRICFPKGPLKTAGT